MNERELKTDTHAATPVEKVFATVINVVLWGKTFEAMGLPLWSGRLFAGLSMAASIDPTLPPGWQRLGRFGAAPGVVAVSVLRARGPEVIDGVKDSATKIKNAAADVIDIEPSPEAQGADHG